MSFDYYQILQVQPTATHAEIKASYRRLAKLFHPDKNPASEEQFKLIQQAYETLIDNVRRSKYDAKRNYNITFSQVKKPEPAKKQKVYTFTEPELKHRKYYQEHYKPKQKTTGYNFESTTKTNYKELTYLLISIPAAVALVLLLINLYKQAPKEEHAQIENNTAIFVPEIKTAEIPYKEIFGKEIFDTASMPCIEIKNPGDYDVVVFLRNNKKKIIRHYFIEHNYRLFIDGIPKGIYTLYYYTGKDFIYKKQLLKNIMGNFKEAICIDSFPNKIEIKPINQDSFLFSIPRMEIKNTDTLLLKRIFKFN